MLLNLCQRSNYFVIGFMVSVKITVLLLVMNWVHLCSTLNDECLRDMDDGQGTLSISLFTKLMILTE